MKPRELKKLLKQHHWTFERYGKGDHEIWTDGTHHLSIDAGANEIPIGLLRASLKFAGISLEAKTKRKR